MKALHRIFGVLTCFPVVLSLLLLPLLPERIPAHYNLYGQVDRWGSRLEVLLLPLCCLVGGLIWKRLIQKMSLTQPQNQKPILVAARCWRLWMPCPVSFSFSPSPPQMSRKQDSCCRSCSISCWDCRCCRWVLPCQRSNATVSWVCAPNGAWQTTAAGSFASAPEEKACC